MGEILFLGTGNAFSDSGDRPSLTLIKENNMKILLDCGPSVLPALYSSGNNPSTIDIIYISHLHPDHYSGLFYLFIENYYVHKKSIDIIAPVGFKELFHKVFSAMYEEEYFHMLDIYFKIYEISQSKDLVIKDYKFNVFPAIHPVTANILTLTLSSGKTIGYSGDTAFNLNLINRLLSCDITIHECTTYNMPIPSHTHIIDFLENDINIPSTCKLFLIHHDSTMIENSAKLLKKYPQIIIPRDGYTFVYD